MSIHRQISDALLIRSEGVIRLARSAPHRYKVFEIPKKKTGRMRVIAQPAREVKRLQRWVMRAVVEDLPIHATAVAYRRGVGLRENASRHAGSSYLLKLDFKDFFPSIRAQDFRNVLAAERPDLSAEDVELICRILFWRRKGRRELVLAIGAPSSPMVSNVVMRDFDAKVASESKEKGIVYTRYADDLTFSSAAPRLLGGFHERVKEICAAMSSPRLVLNEGKTIYSSKKHRRRVTGLILTNEGSVSLGRERKRVLRAGVHRLSVGALRQDEVEQLRGWIAFATDVEPEFVERLENRYGAVVLRRLLLGPK